MTTLLQRAISQVEKLPIQDQDAIAAWLLAELEDERQWSTRFAATTDDQWDRLVENVRRDVAAGRVVPLDEAFSRSEVGACGNLPPIRFLQENPDGTAEYQ